MANIGTSTVAYATRQTAGQLVFIASDGSACVLWCDGTNQVIAYDDNTYASWTKATHTTGLNMCLCGDFRAGTDNIDTVTGGTANVRGNYRLLTKSGATWTVGTSNAMSGTTAIGVTAQGSPTVYGGQDAQGRHWVAVSGATNTLETTYYSPANSPTTTGWTAGGAVTQTADLFTPAADQIGNYFLKIYWNGTALQWHRVDNSGVSVGTWTTGATITNLTGSPNASSAVNFRAISATTGLLTYSSGSGIYAQLYDVAGNSWGTATQLSTNANDRHPVIATDKAGKAWVVWCSYAAANNYALVFKQYNGATWDAGATTLVASGTNIAYPNAGYGFGTLGVTYTQGTASPYTVGWITQAVGPFSRTIPTSAAFEGPGPLTLYGSATADATLPNACDVATVAGGVETSKVSSFSGAGTLGEVYSKGGAVTAVSAIPSTPTGHGWAYQPGAGTFRGTTAWDAIITCAAGANSGSWRLRFFKYDGATTYTPITTLTTSITATAKTVYNFPASTVAAVTFLSTDYLYWDVWYEDTFGAASETATCYMAATSAAGVANEMQITTPIFDPAGGGGTNTIPTSAALLAEKSRTITSSAALLATMPVRTIPTSAALAAGVTTLTRTITSSAALLATMPVRTIPTSAPLLATKTRTVGSSAALLAEKSRTIGTSAPLLVEKSRTLTTSASLLVEKSRTVTSSAALLLEKSRTVPSSAALLAEKSRTIPSSAAFQAQLSRTVSSVAAFSLAGGGVRTIPTSAAFSLAVRTIPTSATLVLIQSRTIPTSAPLQSQSSRTIPTTLASLQEKSRTVGSSAAFLLEKSRTVASSAAFLAEKSRTVPSAAAFSALGTLTRTIPSLAALLQTSTRTVGSSAAFLLEKARTVTSSAALQAVKSRTVATSAALSLLGTLTRTIPTSASFSLAVRTVPTSAAFSLTQTRTVASSAALLATKARTVSTSVPLLLEKTRTIPTSTPLLVEKIRTISSSAAFSLGNARVIPTSGALSGVQARTIPTAMALIATKTRTISTRAAFSQARVIPTVAAFISTRTRTITTVAALTSGSYVLITTQAALQATQTRQVPSTVSVILIIPNALVSVPSGMAAVEIRSGTGQVHVPSGIAALSID